jgi:hypothetical protein
MHKVTGECHCGNILVDIELAQAPSTYSPRVCDCDFCRKHGASYVSDARGSLLIRIKNKREIGRYRQGSGLAEFLYCKDCGVLVGVFYWSAGRLYGAINARIVDVRPTFGAEQSVSPRKLSDDAKVKRWQEIWFADVSGDIVGA